MTTRTTLSALALALCVTGASSAAASEPESSPATPAESVPASAPASMPVPPPLGLPEATVERGPAPPSGREIDTLRKDVAAAAKGRLMRLLRVKSTLVSADPVGGGRVLHMVDASAARMFALYLYHPKVRVELEPLMARYRPELFEPLSRRFELELDISRSGKRLSEPGALDPESQRVHSRAALELLDLLAARHCGADCSRRLTRRVTVDRSAAARRPTVTAREFAVDGVLKRSRGMTLLGAGTGLLIPGAGLVIASTATTIALANTCTTDCPRDVGISGSLIGVGVGLVVAGAVLFRVGSRAVKKANDVIASRVLVKEDLLSAPLPALE